MRVQLISTSKIVNLNGVPSRVWEGETASGIKVHAFITRIAVRQGDNADEFERELLECDQPSPEVQSYPNSLIL